MSFLLPPLHSLTKALLFPTDRRSGTEYFARLAVLQSWQNNCWYRTRQETHFLYPHIKKKGGQQTVKGRAFGLIPCCPLLLPAWQKGIVWVWGLHKLLDFPVQLLFTHRLACRWPEPPAICSIYPLVRITMHTAFSFIIADDCVNRSLCALAQLKPRPLGTDTWWFSVFPHHIYGPRVWSMVSTPAWWKPNKAPSHRILS